jgi:hypothetical protein
MQCLCEGSRDPLPPEPDARNLALPADCFGTNHGGIVRAEAYLCSAWV